MAKKDFGKLHICGECGTKFFDFNSEGRTCPKCGLAESGEPRKKPVSPKKTVEKPKRENFDEIDDLDDIDGDYDGEFDEELDGDFPAADEVSDKPDADAGNDSTDDSDGGDGKTK
ncbi:MAG: FYDLN acid domain-containing protein [Candidatus Lernaella stagnicola]|nr:FYDLN acid domain-containing protein [Candidatus Lernaella stagnicola]